MSKPRARTDNLIAEEIWDEVVVYDQADDRVHRLNASAATVWRHSDGTRTTADLAAVLHERLGVPADEALVHLALDHLGQANLLAGPPSNEGAMAAMSRRELLDRLKVAAYLLPVVASIVAPVPLAAASGSSSPTTPTPTPTPTPPAPGIVPQVGTYGPGSCSLQSQSCTPSFFNSGFTETCTIGAGLTSCTISDPNGAPRVSTGSVSGAVGTYTGSGAIGSVSGSWTVTCTWTSNQTIVVREALHANQLNCDGVFQSVPLTRQ